MDFPISTICWGRIMTHGCGINPSLSMLQINFICPALLSGEKYWTGGIQKWKLSAEQIWGKGQICICCLCCLQYMLCMLNICASMRTMKNCNNARQAVMWQLLAAAATESRIQILKLDLWQLFSLFPLPTSKGHNCFDFKDTAYRFLPDIP